MMPPKLRGKWALGIQPRNFTWILKDKMAVCERPVGLVRATDVFAVKKKSSGFGKTASITSFR